MCISLLALLDLFRLVMTISYVMLVVWMDLVSIRKLVEVIPRFPEYCSPLRPIKMDRIRSMAGTSVQTGHT
ncbi:MAG: hypothetical protein AVDCRST_MAG43-441 [uncultured Thermomicrobiales bacterium]|uniref:Uncharacterized protein n=1 Tax=uncultured Thermomicrobiales bacterium TaxID=1645740 RepID=A0A6J4U9V9_9BACT|nr:MAG: hypothetical protein AVDCRST_MAG43-441 [uncultured Thermomicrobiales bacterium]